MNKNDKIICDICQVEIIRNKYSAHLKTNLHKRRCLSKTIFPNVSLVASAFKCRLASYRIDLPECHILPDTFLYEVKDTVRKLIRAALIKHKVCKINLELFAFYFLPHSGKEEMKSFNLKYKVFYPNSNIDSIFQSDMDKIVKKCSEFQQRESGWTLSRVSHLEVNINRYTPLRSGTYMPLPLRIRSTKSCVNIQNKDDHCFLWAVIAFLYPVTKNCNRVTSYPHYSNILNTNGMTFPVSVEDIKVFEKNNPCISVNVYGLDSKHMITGPLYKTEVKQFSHVNLLYIESADTGHYCLIKDFSRLVNRQVTKHKSKLLFCDDCILFFPSEDKMKKHDCSRLCTILPEPGSTLEFTHYERMQKIPFVIYGDFESLLLPVDTNMAQSTTFTQVSKQHIPAAFAYNICCTFDTKYNKLISYRGPDCVQVFLKELRGDIIRINKILRSNTPMLPLSNNEIEKHNSATVCHICDGYFFLDDKVHDHDHITGRYRGAAHSYCNLVFKSPTFVPFLFHNLAGYDSHLFIKELIEMDGLIKIIPKTTERYISFTKFFETDSRQNKFAVVKFIDSYMFLSTSLEKLADSLNEEHFISLASFCKSTERFKLARRKGIYPYEYMDSWDKYNQLTLPSREHFYNTLSQSHITSEDFLHAKQVWDIFKVKDLGEYTDIYLKTDVLILTDVFEMFRKTSLVNYKLDPCYYVSAPGFSWDAMLLKTRAKMDLISDLEIYQMLERGIRGGLSQCSMRYAKANNKYMNEFDKKVPSSYILYLDCNNLYGFCLMKKLPISEFRLLSDDEIACIDLNFFNEDSEIGLILEVDLEYPQTLHDLHCDLPFAPEKFTPPGGKTSKLIGNLYDKYKYVIHYLHLKECLEHGLKLKKIHRVLSFKQDAFLKDYIDLNTRLRQIAQTSFEQDFFKLLNNSIFGKTLENKRNQMDVKLAKFWTDTENITNKKFGAQRLISQPNFHKLTIFSENCAAIQLKLSKIILDRPLYIGFTVLELSKMHLYNFHYSVMKSIYGKKASLCYTDTDSLLYHITDTDDVYRDIKRNIQYFDTSNFSINNQYNLPIVNKKCPGLFKDELGGEIVTEFVGLRSKLYSIKTQGKEIKKAKGLSKHVTEQLNIEEYKNALTSDSIFRKRMTIFKSIKHNIFSMEINKSALNKNDDKRFITDENRTLAWGHYNIV